MTIARPRWLMGIIASTALAATAVPAMAIPVLWTLQDVTFTDGGTAAGSFTFDAGTSTVLSWSITADGGTNAGLPGPFTYSSAPGTQLAEPQVFGADGQAFLFDSRVFTGAVTRQLRLDPVALLTDVGGTIALDLIRLGFNLECINCNPVRFIASGSVAGTPVAAPAPGTAGLLGLSLLGVARLTRGRRHGSRSAAGATRPGLGRRGPER